MSDYDIDDYGVDDFELAQEDMDGGLFDSYDGGKERPAGMGSVYDKPQTLDPRELADDEEWTPEDVEALLLETLPEDEVEDFIVNTFGSFANQWEAMEEHNIYYNPWYAAYKKQEHYDRYWGDHGWEKLRHRKLKRAKWWEDPEQSRFDQRQKNKKHYYTNIEKAREGARKRMAAYRARKRAEKEAQKNEL